MMFRKPKRIGDNAYMMDGYVISYGKSFVVPGSFAMEDRPILAPSRWISLYDSERAYGISFTDVYWNQEAGFGPLQQPPRVTLKGTSIAAIVHSTIYPPRPGGYVAPPPTGELKHLIGYPAADNGGEVTQPFADVHVSTEESRSGLAILLRASLQQGDITDLGSYGEGLLCKDVTVSVMLPWELVLIMAPSAGVVERLLQYSPEWQSPPQ